MSSSNYEDSMVGRFPAYAGVILVETTSYKNYLRLSRIRGGDPKPIKVSVSTEKSFPHTRGRADLPKRLKRSARRQFGTPNLLRVESTVCFQRKRGLAS